MTKGDYSYDDGYFSSEDYVNCLIYEILQDKSISLIVGFR